jgi:hypothetical protein
VLDLRNKDYHTCGVREAGLEYVHRTSLDDAAGKNICEHIFQMYDIPETARIL